MSIFDTETRYFEEHRQEWAAIHYGKFAVIKDEAVYGFYDTGLAAYENGVDQFQMAPFLIKEVLPQDAVYHAPAMMNGLLCTHH